MRIEPLEKEHLEEVTAMEAEDGDVHWSRAQFEEELEGEFRRFFLMLDDDSRILAFGGYWKAAAEAQIVNLVVRRDSRCRGLAKRLMEFLMDCARSEMCARCTLEVR